MTNNHEYYLTYVYSEHSIPNRFRETYRKPKEFVKYYEDNFILIQAPPNNGKTHWCFDYIKARLKWVKNYDKAIARLDEECEKIPTEFWYGDNQQEGRIWVISEEDEKRLDHYEKQKSYCSNNLYVDWKSFYRDYHKWTNDEQAYFRNKIAHFTNGLVVLDDLPCFETQAQKDLFHAVINDRYMFDLPTVLVTQYELEVWEDSVLPETMRRINEICRKI